MTGRRATTLSVIGLLVAAVAAWWLWPARLPSAPHGETSSARPPAEPRALVATLRGEPATFNRFIGVVFPTHLVSLLTQAPLVRINRVTQELEPWLADRWTRSDDGRRFGVHLREGVQFSDGHPFTSADVVFSFQAAYDAATASPIAGALLVDGKPLEVRAASPDTVEIVFPAPYGPGLRLLDNLPIYPAHLLQGALAAGQFGKAWGPTTTPSEMAGLGPFVLETYQPGERLTFARNPHYWRRDPDGRPLPAIDRLTLEIVPDQNAELLRLEAGQVDLLQSELRPEDYLPVKRDADTGKVRLLDVGRSLDAHVLWFNLRLPARGVGSRAFLRKDEFRLALSHAVDRAQFARAVYLGAAEPMWGAIAPSNRDWFDATVPHAEFDTARSSALLAGIGLRDRNGDGTLDDPGGAAVRFTLLVQKGNTASEKGAAVLRERFAAIGVAMDVVALDIGAMMGRWLENDYDAIYHLLSPTDTDPAGNLDFWLSSGRSHVWNPGQAQPATEWERRIDGLMRRQAASLDPAERQRLFGEVQHVFAEHSPALTFAAPHVYVATSARVRAGPAGVQRPQLLWNADTLSVTAPPVP